VFFVDIREVRFHTYGYKPRGETKASPVVSYMVLCKSFRKKNYSELNGRNVFPV
jgi:hypothetical protein